jgi:hypothetical protein
VSESEIEEWAERLLGQYKGNLMRVSVPEEYKSTYGVKDDGQKSPIFQGVLDIFPRALEAVADVSAFGAKKYSWDNWKFVKDGQNRYTNAMIRHLNKESRGEIFDKETNLYHAASVAWNALARLELILVENSGEEK